MSAEAGRKTSLSSAEDISPDRGERGGPSGFCLRALALMRLVIHSTRQGCPVTKSSPIRGAVGPAGATEGWAAG